MKYYDYLIVGCGLYGATVAYRLKQMNKSVLIIDKKSHIAGNIYTENIHGINVHKYGPHIFHTSNKEVWNFVNQFTEFNHYKANIIANYKQELYNLPFNMNTFYKLWNIIVPEEVRKKISLQINEVLSEEQIKKPKNLEEQAISLIGTDVYNILIKGYTEKQWGKKCTELPPDIIRRLPVRLSYNNDYFNDIYQGIPIGGYTQMIEKMIQGCDIKLNVDYISNRDYYNSITDKIIYTGKIDEFFDYCYGELEYRSLKFVNTIKNIPNFQGCAIMNYTTDDIPYTRCIEHKHFECIYMEDLYKHRKTVLTYEYPQKWDKTKDAYYPINNKENNDLYNKYKELSNKEEYKHIIFGGRLAEYKYYDMDDVIEAALNIELL